MGPKVASPTVSVELGSLLEGLIMFHEMGIDGESCSWDSGSNDVTCVYICFVRLRNSIRIICFSWPLRQLDSFYHIDKETKQ